jgi:hypothetical protein
VRSVARVLYLLALTCEKTMSKFPSCHFIVIKYVQTGITCEKVGLGWVALCQVSDAHAHSIVVNDVIITPREFQHPSQWYNRVYEIINYEYGVVG